MNVNTAIANSCIKTSEKRVQPTLIDNGTQYVLRNTEGIDIYTAFGVNYSYSFLSLISEIIQNVDTILSGYIVPSILLDAEIYPS